jgi:hypothetical protein
MTPKLLLLLLLLLLQQRRARPKTAARPSQVPLVAQAQGMLADAVW